MKKIIFNLSLFIVVACFSLPCFAVSFGNITLRSDAGGNIYFVSGNVSNNISVYRTNLSGGYVIYSTALCSSRGSSATELDAISEACKAVKNSANSNVKRIQNHPDLFFVKNPGFDLGALSGAKPAGAALMVTESITGKSMMTIEEDK